MRACLWSRTAMRILAPLAASLIQMAISRSREFQADLDGARTVQDPEALASALAKLQMGAQRIPMQVADGATVRPFPATEQRQFTRSLVFPAWFARWILLNFDAHELHHAYPQIPGYRLVEFARETVVGPTEGRTVSWWRWMYESRRISGDQLLFQNSDETGYDI